MSLIVSSYVHETRQVWQISSPDWQGGQWYQVASDKTRTIRISAWDEIAVAEWSLSNADLYRKLLVHMLRQTGSSVVLSVPLAAIYTEVTTDTAVAEQRTKNRAAIQLLQQWLDDDSGYDEVVWPKVKQTLEENRLSYRTRFDD